MNNHDKVVAEFLALYGLPNNVTTRAQLYVFVMALRVFADRELKYRDGWRERGWKGNVNDLLRKAGRVRRMFWDSDDHHPYEDPDDIIDMMNYGAFLLRNAQEGNITGKRYIDPVAQEIAWSFPVSHPSS